MTTVEVEQWISRWKSLTPTPQRDQVIKIWTRFLQYGR